MNVARISFHTNTRDEFNNDDGYDGISITELETLLRLSRQGTLSLEGELMKRQHDRISDQPGEVGNICVRLHNTARELSVTERLSDQAANRVDEAVTLLTTFQTGSQPKTYQAFLYDILRHCGKIMFLLCAATFRKKAIIDLGSQKRVNLLAYLRATSFEFPVLSTLASEHKVPSLDSPRISHITTRARKRARHADDVEGGSQEEATKQTQLSSEHGQRNPEALCEAVHPFSLQHEQQKPTAADSVAPYRRDREMKDMYTNAPASSISKMPEPFKTAVQKTELWKSERNQNLTTTGTLAILFPKDNTQDVSVTIWCSHDDGYHLSNYFKLEHAMSC